MNWKEIEAQHSKEIEEWRTLCREYRGYLY